MSMKISDALAQLDLLAGVLLLSAQTRSMMKLTTGMSMRIIVIIQSPTETTDVLRENCSWSYELGYGVYGRQGSPEHDGYRGIDCHNLWQIMSLLSMCHASFQTGATTSSVQ